MSETFEIFKKAYDFIFSILRDNPATRADDTELIFKVWEKQGIIFTDSQKYLIRKAYSPETISRSRRKVQENGFFRPNKFVQEQRSLLEEEFRNNINTNIKKKKKS